MWKHGFLAFTYFQTPRGENVLLSLVFILKNTPGFVLFILKNTPGCPLGLLSLVFILKSTPGWKRREKASTALDGGSLGRDSWTSLRDGTDTHRQLLTPRHNVALHCISSDAFMRLGYFDVTMCGWCRVWTSREKFLRIRIDEWKKCAVGFDEKQGNNYLPLHAIDIDV